MQALLDGVLRWVRPAASCGCRGPVLDLAPELVEAPSGRGRSRGWEDSSRSVQFEDVRPDAPVDARAPEMAPVLGRRNETRA